MRGRPPQIQSDDLLDAARDVFLRDGQATTTAKIAEAAGVSEGILFYRYKTKDGLLAAVILRETRVPPRLVELSRAAGTRTPAENLLEIVFELIDAISRAHRFISLAESGSWSHEVHRILFEEETPPPVRNVKLIATYLAGEMRLGRLGRFDAVTAARTVSGAVVEHVRFGPKPTQAANRAFARSLVNLLLHGMARIEPQE